MKGTVLREPNKPLTVEQVELAPPKEREVLVKTSYTGFCHTDLAIIQGILKLSLPLVPGHEASGVVEAVGPGVTTLKKGDHVVATWRVACGHCPECRKGMGHLCSNCGPPRNAGTLLDMSSRLADDKGRTLHHQTFVSGFAQYMVIPEAGAIKIREDLPLDQACFLSCCLPTGFGAVYNVAQVKPGDSVAIWGMGGVGLNVVRGARLRGANPIIGVDLVGSKEGIAREFGVTHFVDGSKEDPVPIVQALTGGGANFCFEVIGDPGAIIQAFYALGMAGKLVQIGLTDEQAMTRLPLFYSPLHCKSILGTLYGNIQTEHDIPALADGAMRGDFLLDKLITRKFKIEEINDVVEAMDRHEITGRWVCDWGE